MLNFLRRLFDFLTVMIGFALGYIYYVHGGNRHVPYSFLQYLFFSVFAGALFVSVFQTAQLYERETSLLQVVETRRLLLSWFVGSLLLLGSSFYLRILDLSRIMTTTSLGITFFLLLIERSVVYRWSIFFHSRRKIVSPVIIYGAGIVGRHLFKRIYHSPALGLHILGFLDDDAKLWNEEVPIREIGRARGNLVLGGLDRLEELVKRHGVSEVFVAMPTASYQRNLEIAQACTEMNINVAVVPPTYGRKMHSVEVRDIGGIPILREKVGKPKFYYPFLKRIYDLVVSLFSIIVLSPLMILIAGLIKLDSPGPVVFRQKRIGRNGQAFDFFKFRSMYTTANPYDFTPQSAEDLRITRFGRFLRRSSFDELPQFFNVLLGTMSIVGPRPEMPFIVESYNEEQKERLKVKPGITGVWQISAVRGDPIHANMEYDLFYIEHQSILLDAIIMVKTIGTAIRGIGAV